MIKNVSVEEFWNGIKIENYKINVIMNKTITTLEHKGKITIGEEFRHKDLEEKLNEYVNKYNKVLLNIPYGDLKRRFKTLTEKFGYKIERTTYFDGSESKTDRIYAVLTK